jgi:hypothetical protein
MEDFDRTNFEDIVGDDVTELEEAHKHYGISWRKRGGVGAFMMLARKWDRLENKVVEFNWDIFIAMEDDQREEGILDDIRDLRRYLLLVEEFVNTTKEEKNNAEENYGISQAIEA